MASIRQMPRGTWQAIVRRNGHRPQFRTFETKQDAKQWARLIEFEIDRAVFVDRGPSERVPSPDISPRLAYSGLGGEQTVSRMRGGAR
jgi:hypothetical protein